MSPIDDTDELVRRAGLDDATAMGRLLSKHRDRLRRMISVRMDRRLASRLDPSDVLQEVLADAAARLPTYARQRPLPFYPWLRQLAWDHLVDLYHLHILAGKRTVLREERFDVELSDQSLADLASQLAARTTSPSVRLLRAELHQRAREALAQLNPDDREILVMRHLEQLQLSEIAALLGITEGAVKMRRLRAMQRLRQLLGVGPTGAGDEP